MRIWVQSNTALRTDPAWAGYTATLERHLNAVKSDGTTIDVVGVEKMENDVEGSAFDRYYNVRQVLECGLKAQEQGYDAFLVVGLGIAGYEELRDVLSIPVIYAESVAWNMARWQYGRFGLVSHESSIHFRRIEQIRVHGSLPFFVPGDYCNFTGKQIRDGFGDPKEIVRALEASSLRAVQNGACVLIPVFNVLNDLLIEAGVTHFHGVPVLDVAGLSLRAAEFLVGARQKSLL